MLIILLINLQMPVKCPVVDGSDLRLRCIDMEDVGFCRAETHSHCAQLVGCARCNNRILRLRQDPSRHPR